jgi:hypothetical protein
MAARFLLRCLVVDAVRLSDVLARRGVLAPAEVVTLVVGLALELADLHAAGRTHGGVCADAVSFAPDGRPVLSSGSSTTPIAPETARGGPPGPAADVFAVAAIGYLALSGRSVWDTDDADRACVRAAAGLHTPLSGPPRLVAALEAGLADDPDQRCTARDLAERVLASGPAAPLRLPLSGDGQDHRGITAIEPRQSASSRRRRLVAVGVVGLIVAMAFAVTHGAQQPDRWDEVLAGLDRARLAALTDANVSELADVYAPGSPQLTRDTALIRDLTRHGWTIRGRLAQLSAPRLLRRDVANAVLGGVELPAAYVVVDRRGRIVLRVDGGRSRDVVVRLRRTTTGWRVVAVS